MRSSDYYVAVYRRCTVWITFEIRWLCPLGFRGRGSGGRVVCFFWQLDGSMAWHTKPGTRHLPVIQVDRSERVSTSGLRTKGNLIP